MMKLVSCKEPESNRLQLVYQTNALPNELSLLVCYIGCVPLAGEEGVEPSVACMLSRLVPVREPRLKAVVLFFNIGSVGGHRSHLP